MGATDQRKDSHACKRGLAKKSVIESLHASTTH
ncbi:hypothetical protein HRED_11257 [Candidatus Haloredivivus sp. G17]|nr:hypothetical protein HRED_11257 [Candidatus Haloredivivus sp. G17]